MKVAYFSPFPPKQTGIATYSDHLVAEVRKIIEVDCYDFDNAAATNAADGFADFAVHGRIRDLTQYDNVVYHLGNNPGFHLDIYRTFRAFPGIVVLHDVVLYFLFAGLGASGLIKHFLLNYGIDRIGEIDAIVRDSIDGNILRYQRPELHPLTKSVTRYARRIIVHNRAAQQMLLASGYAGPVHILPLISYPIACRPEDAELEQQWRRRLSLQDGELIIGCFGFLGRTKRLEQICQALSRIGDGLHYRFLIVGEGDDPAAIIASHGLEKRTIHTRFVSDEDFVALLGMTDILLNLRFPSMGESSATLTQAMSLGKACIISDDAAFATIPADCAIKIRPDQDEVANLANAILALGRDPAKRGAMGEAASRFTRANFSGEKVATAFVDILAQDIAEPLPAATEERSRDLNSIALMRELLASRLADRLPAHLRVTP